MIRVTLPYHLRNLARVSGGEVLVAVEEPPTIGRLLDALESAHPEIKGTLRDHVTGRRRPLVRFFACGEDLSHEPPDRLLPDAVRSGEEPFMVVGAIAGGRDA